MNEQKCIGIFCIAFVVCFFLGLVLGAWGATIYTRIESGKQLAELAGKLAEAERRAERIGRGLAEGVEIATRSTDRERRIAILIEAIDRAIADLAGQAAAGNTDSETAD